METAHVQLIVMVLAALMVIVVVGAGTTLVYLAEARRGDVPSDRPTPGAGEDRAALTESTRGTAAGHDRAA